MGVRLEAGGVQQRSMIRIQAMEQGLSQSSGSGDDEEEVDPGMIHDLELTELVEQLGMRGREDVQDDYLGLCFCFYDLVYYGCISLLSLP